MGLFKDFFVLSSAKKIRRRNFYDPPSPHIVQYRNFKTPSPPKKVRRLLWTAPNWFRSYGLRCSERPCECLVNSKNVATDKWPFYDHVLPFSPKNMVIFNKTEIQTVILSCLTSLNLNWFQRYDEKRKKAKSATLHFF